MIMLSFYINHSFSPQLYASTAGAGSSAGVMPQQGSGWMAYAGSPYAPTHAQPAPPRPVATHTSVQNQATVVQVVR